MKQITANHMICSVHFQGGMGYCKADPFPTVYNDPAMANRFNSTPKKRKAPRSRSLSSQVKRKLSFENAEAASKDSSETSTSTSISAVVVEKIVSQQEGLPVESADEASVMADRFVHDHDPAAINHDHTYASLQCSVGTQTLLSSEDLDKQQEEITQLKTKLEDTETLRRELFIAQATSDDSSVRFYTGIPTLALLMSIFNIIKPAAEKMKYWVKGQSTKIGKYMVRIMFFNVVIQNL